LSARNTISNFGGAGDFQVVLKVDAGIGLGARMPPRGDVMARGIEEGPEPHLAFCAHRRSD
jgi:hypothetical protein